MLKETPSINHRNILQSKRTWHSQLARYGFPANDHEFFYSWRRKPEEITIFVCEQDSLQRYIEIHCKNTKISSQKKTGSRIAYKILLYIKCIMLAYIHTRGARSISEIINHSEDTHTLTIHKEHI